MSSILQLFECFACAKTKWPG